MVGWTAPRGKSFCDRALVRKKHRFGVLLVEAVVASFVMVFAFIAAGALFDTALQWESKGNNERKAALIAERKMEELRAASRALSAGSPFAAQLDAIIAAPHPAYADAPGFDITVTALPNTHQQIPANLRTPTDGVHSPCSLFFTEVLPLPYPFDPDGDAQRNARYETYPYTRPMLQSYRLVEVNVAYGSGGQRNFRLVSLISEPIVRTNTLTLNVTRVLGGTNLTPGSPVVEFEFTASRPPGIPVEEAVAIWNLTPNSTGTGLVEPSTLDASGSRFRVELVGTNAFASNNIQAAVKVRYAGREFVGLSEVINIP